MKNYRRRYQNYSRFYWLIIVILTGLVIWSTTTLAQQRRDAEAIEASYKQQLEQANKLIENQKAQLAEQHDQIAQLENIARAYEREVDELLERLSVYESDLVVTVAAPRHLDVPLDDELQDYIYTLCCAYGTDEMYELMYAVIKRESQFDAAALSPTNDYGLMQINIGNHKWLSSELGIVDFLDPYENVHAGVYMLSSLIHKYDYNLNDALMAYNMGERNARKLWGRGVHTTPYAEQVLDYYEQFTGNI